MLHESISRRILLGAGAVALTAPHIPSTVSTAAARSTAAGALSSGSPAGEAHGFLAVPPDRGDRVTVPEGFAYDVLIRWRDPVLAGAAPFDFGNQTEAAQSGQFGPNNDYCALVPLRSDGRRARRLRTRMTFLPAKRATGHDPRPCVAAARDASRPGGGGGTGSAVGGGVTAGPS